MNTTLTPIQGIDAITDDVLPFLKMVPPFQLLEESSLHAVAASLTLEYYPKGTVILKQDDSASDALRIVKKGGVRVSLRTEGGESMTIDHRGVGETFGLISIMGKDRQKTTVVALEDTACYLLGREKIVKLIESNPAFTEYFLQSHFTRYFDKVYRDMHSKGMFYGSSDHLLFTTPVGDIVAGEVATVRDDATIRTAAVEMSNRRVTSLIIIDRTGLPKGIITDEDLRSKVVARGRSVNDQVRDIMSLPLVRIDAADFCFEAVLKMVKHNVDHILVIRDGALSGVLTNHDLMMLQGTSPLSIAKDLEREETLEGLSKASARINRVAGILLREGARISNITRIITELNDRLVRKVLEIAEKQCGRPPLPYAWLVFGSEGRKEQVFRTDQDNGLLYADPATPELGERAREYFGKFAVAVRDGLKQCGYPHCPDNAMAVDPRWCQPLAAWKQQYAAWAGMASPDQVLPYRIFFDLRCLHGEEALAADLKSRVNAILKNGNLLVGNLAAGVKKLKPSLGFFNTFVVAGDGEHKGKVNLKTQGIGPLVDLIRLFALQAGISETSTFDRIEALRPRNPLVGVMADEIAQAFEFLMLLQTRHQADQYEQGRVPDGYIDPYTLGSLDKRMLRESLQAISRMLAN